MEPATPSAEPQTLDNTGLCLLSIDGGGVRGLSTLYILKQIMKQVNHERKTKFDLPSVKPCQVFDLIGGSSTGGLIAIMLGRLEMDVDECIAAYTQLAARVFRKKSSLFPFNLNGKIKSRYDSRILASAVRQVIVESKYGVSENDMLDDGVERTCRTFVCVADCDTQNIVQLRSYSLPSAPEIPLTICQAALATSAAATFFDIVNIGGRKFADGGFGASNPVERVKLEAQKLWCPNGERLEPLVKCFLSIGTGDAGPKAFKTNAIGFVTETMVDLATETEDTANLFAQGWAQHFDDHRLFRFSVDHGLQNVQLDEYKKNGEMKAATDRYLDRQVQQSNLQHCSRNLSLKINKSSMTFSASLVASIPQAHVEQDPRSDAAGDACWLVPFERNIRFVGRSGLLQELEAKLFVENRTQRIAIMGLGGVGKTNLALEIIFRTKEKHPECSIFWIAATTLETLQQGFVAVAKALNIPGMNEKDADARKLVREHLSKERSRHWLLVFDNCDDIEMWTTSLTASDGTLYRLIDCLPKSELGSILFTTRDRKAALDLAPLNVINVPEMGDDEATHLLKHCLLNSDLAHDETVTEKLLDELSHLPLAIVQASAYINKNSIMLEEYIELMQEQEEDVINLLSENFEDEVRSSDFDSKVEGPSTRNPVATTWLISFNRIRDRDPLAANYLCFIACVEPKDIPFTLLPPGDSRSQEKTALGTLAAYSFIQKRPTETALDVHRLVHLATRNWLRREDQLRPWTETVIETLKDALPWRPINPNSRHEWAVCIPHADFVLKSDTVERDLHCRIDLMEKVAGCLKYDGRYRDAERWQREALRARKRVQGPEHRMTLLALSSLGGTCFSLSRYEEAEGLFNETISTGSRVLEPDDKLLLHTSTRLVQIYTYLDRFEEAEVLGIPMLEACIRVLGHEDRTTITLMDSLARVQQELGQLEKAGNTFLQCLEIGEKVLGKEHLVTLATMNNLAILYEKQGRLNDAEQLYLKAIEVRKKVVGQDHPETLITMHNLANLYRRQKRFSDSEALFLRVIEANKRVWGEDYPKTLMSIACLSNVYRDQKRYEDEAILLSQLLETIKAMLGIEHQGTLMIMHDLACAWWRLYREVEAINMMSRCAELRKGVLGAGHKDTISSLRQLNEWQEMKTSSPLNQLGLEDFSTNPEDID